MTVALQSDRTYAGNSPYSLPLTAKPTELGRGRAQKFRYSPDIFLGLKNRTCPGKRGRLVTLVHVTEGIPLGGGGVL